METLSPAQARRLALSAQGFGAAPPASVSRTRLLRTVERLGVVQIDSVNVLVRSHYLPLFSRLGPYDRAALEEAAWGRRKALFEYWGHEASLMPLDLQPMLRWRMEDARAGRGVWGGVARFLASHRDFIDRALREIRDRGPLAASELGLGAAGQGGWWGWSEAKRALECLFWTGELTCATRRGSFERVYGLPEQVLPQAVVEAPTPSREAAQRALVLRAAAALGVATERDLRDYFRMSPAETKARVAELVAGGELETVRVKGWRDAAYIRRGAKVPRRTEARALLSPFDNLVWFRERAERLFGVRIRLEIYTPAEKRTHGYYVLPFLQGEAITARVDLKADRKAGVLRVQAAHGEPGEDAETPHALAGELQRLADWLGLARVEVGGGELAGRLGAALAAPAVQLSRGTAR